MKTLINLIHKTFKRSLNDVVYLDIETTGNNYKINEIIEIGAIKLSNGHISTFNSFIKNKYEIPIEMYSLSQGCIFEDLKVAPDIQTVEVQLKEFIKDYPIIIHDNKNQKKFIKHYLKSIDNEILNSVELAAMLEPYHNEFSIDYLKKQITTDINSKNNRALYGSWDIAKLVNSLILRLKKEEETTLEPLTFRVNSYLHKFGMKAWNWSKFIDNFNYEFENFKYDVILSKDKNCETTNNRKEQKIISKIFEHNRCYEELLKEQGIWASKEGFIYEYRQGQYELTKTIRETIKGNSGSAKVACIEAPTGIGKSVGYLVPAMIEARINKKRIIISTDTKELQIQLINKDIPNVLNSLGLNNKIKYGYIKGKNNYICVEKLEHYKNDYASSNPEYDEIISILILEQLIKDGIHGDIEEINTWITTNFPYINNHLKHVSCDPNLCRPKKCYKECLYKKRIEELKEEDITVINHSLLAKWPYKEEKPLENIIVDEGHNLVEKGYDFFSSTVEYKSLMYFLREIYPYENMANSKFIYVNNNKNRKIKPFDKFYHHVHFDRNIKDKISRNINLIVDEINSILSFGLNSEYNNISSYNLNWELNLQENEVAGKNRMDDQIVQITYSDYSKKIKISCETIIRNLVAIILIIDKNLDDDSIDKESDVYIFGKAKVKELEDIKNTFEIFMEYSEDDDYARIVEVSKEFTNFEIRVVPLKLAQLFEENILSQVDSAVFLSATLTVEKNMDYFKNTLGINRVNNIEKIINPLYNYRNRVLTIGVSDLSLYNNINFPSEISDVLGGICKVTKGHTLSLFNSKDRLEKTYDNLKYKLNNNNVEIYMNKKDIKNLKDMNRNCVVLGSKGCFEGVDIPGDGLTCVTIDKIPNLNPKDPLYSTIMKKYKLPYHNINYPQMTIKIKQAMGRLLRSKYDYGCFIIFNTGNNMHTLKKLEKDLHESKINIIKKSDINRYIYNHFQVCRQNVINDALNDIINLFKLNKNNNQHAIDFINSQMKNRCLDAYASNLDNNNLKLKYFNKAYLIPKDRLNDN
ncbi:helicase C-terminal domain-containing protein [Romboutsia lituseburensis]|uniref:helicase C-terminal domain-containing protein n=1 Tax=Romboutsia lituseburensis TaxID=1537 RepID=UPI00215B6933|nr:helicase C-terminal domain-containing protein [Romboutsia lituseburensis]MCR8745022.1 exonuclease [Romboutsia lituseburensis]